MRELETSQSPQPVTLLAHSLEGATCVFHVWQLNEQVSMTQINNILTITRGGQ
jgi:hypothetical protein